MTDDRYARGVARLEEIDGAAGDAVIAGLASAVLLAVSSEKPW